MKNLYLLLTCVLLMTDLYAQVPLNAYPLPLASGPTSATVSKRLKSSLKVAPDRKVWIAFTGRRFGPSTYVSNNGIACFDGSVDFWHKRLLKLYFINAYAATIIVIDLNVMRIST